MLISHEQVKEIRDSYNDKNSNETCQSLANKYDVSVEYIRKIVANETHYDPNYLKTKNSEYKFLPCQVKEIRKLYNSVNNTDYSTCKLGKIYGVSRQVISLIINNKIYKDPNYVRTRSNRVSQSYVPTKREINKIRNLYKNGNSVKVISEKLALNERLTDRIIKNEKYPDPNYVFVKNIYDFQFNRCKFTMDQVKEMRARHNGYDANAKELADEFGITPVCMYLIISNKIYKDPNYVRTRLHKGKHYNETPLVNEENK